MKEVIEFVWDKTPWFIKWPLIMMFTPTILIFFFLGWHTESVEGMIRTHKERRDQQLMFMEQKHHLEIKSINENIKYLQNQNGIIYKAVLDLKKEK